MRWITKIKSWQLLVILSTPGFVGVLLPLTWAAKVSLIAVAGVFFYVWQYSAASVLLARIPVEARPSSNLFRFATLYASTYYVVFVMALAMFVDSEVFSYQAPFWVGAMFASLYLYWFIAKVSAQVRGDDQAWTYFATFLFLSPLAIWRTQKLVSRETS